MLKPNSLRQHLADAVPTLKRDPDKLVVLIRDGKIVSTGGASLSFEYRYTLNLVLLDYAEHADAVMVPLLAWLQLNQSEIAENPDLREKALRFEVEFQNATTVDLSIEVDLTERVLVRSEGVGYNVQHVGEPARAGDGLQGDALFSYLHGAALPTAISPL